MLTPYAMPTTSEARRGNSRSRADIDREVDATDQQLWDEAVAGSSAAFGLIFERHARAIYNFCFRRTGSWSVAEDLMSDVFLVAWRRRRDVAFTAEDGTVLPWLYSVALNLLRNRRRSERRATAAFARLDPTAAQADFSDEVVGRLGDERRMRDVLSVFERLAVHEQEVLALCVWAGLSYDDCAVALGVPVGTVRSRLARARAHLMELVAAGGHERNGESLLGTCG